nr:MAG TPA: hypothetical protein [Bacteriophage sp.]
MYINTARRESLLSRLSFLFRWRHPPRRMLT